MKPNHTNKKIKLANDKKKVLDENLPKARKELFQLAKYPILDIKEGITILGSEAAVKDMLSLFVEQAITDEEILTFRTAHANKDWETTSAIAHKLKGACIYCGVLRMRYACQYLECSYKTGSYQFSDKLCQQFLLVFDQTKKYITNWLHSNC